MHAELTHATVDREHGLEDAVAAGEALIINADERHGRVNEDTLRVLLVQKNYGTRHSFIVRSHLLPEGARRVPRFPEAPSGCQPGRSPQRSKERTERPGDGCPCVGAEETCGAPTPE